MISQTSNLHGSSTHNLPVSTMGAAMDTAFAVGAPTDEASATEVSSTAGAYVSGASGMVARIDEGIRSRVAGLGALDASDPTAAAEQREQIDLLERLRDRVRLSVERINDLMAGKDRPDIGSDSGGIEVDGPGSPVSRRAEDLALLEWRRALLAGPEQVLAAPDTVAGTHGPGGSPRLGT